MLSVAHSLGMRLPMSSAARITEVPAGTLTASPSMLSVIISAELRAGVP